MSFLKRYIVVRFLAIPAIATAGTIFFVLLVVIAWTMQICIKSHGDREVSGRAMQIQRYEETLTKGRIASMQLRAKLPTHADRLRNFYKICMEINPGKSRACANLVQHYDRMYWDSVKEYR